MVPAQKNFRSNPKKQARNFAIAVEEHRRASPVERRIGLLKQVDVEVANFSKICEYFLKAERTRLISSVEKSFVNGAKESVGALLKNLYTNRENLVLDPLQVRSLKTFIEKIDSATNAHELNEAFSFFNRNSCILKLPARN